MRNINSEKKPIIYNIFVSNNFWKTHLKFNFLMSEKSSNPMLYGDINKKEHWIYFFYGKNPSGHAKFESAEFALPPRVGHMCALSAWLVLSKF
jgi:hypothetical protein